MAKRDIYVSKKDQDLFDDFTWWINPVGKGPQRLYYARRGGTDLPNLYMHRIIMERVIGRSLRKEERVDHIDYNGLNNKRENLRIATVSQNIFHSRMKTNNTSGIKGVYWDKARKKWKAQICFQYKVIGIGRFDTKEEAHAARHAYAKALQGEFHDITISQGHESL